MQIWVVYNKPNLRKTVAIAITLLMGVSVLSGCTGDEDVDHPIEGIWYQDDDQNGFQFTDKGWYGLTDGLPDQSEWSWQQAPNMEYTWSTKDGILTLESSGMAADGDEEFVCDDGSTIPLSYVNDCWDDCDDGEDEGVDLSTLDVEYNIPFSMEWTWKYEIVGDDVLFMGILSMEYSFDGSTQSASVPEDRICDDDGDGECYGYVRATVMAGALHATIVNGVESPEWWNDNTSDNDW